MTSNEQRGKLEWTLRYLEPFSEEIITGADGMQYFVLAKPTGTLEIAVDYTIYGTNFTATIPPAEMLEGYDPSPDGAADTEWSAGFEIVDGAMTGEVIYSADVDRFPVDDDGEQLFYLLPLIRNEKTVSTGGCYQEDTTCVNGEAMQQLYKIG